jgi:hypothetical protein
MITNPVSTITQSLPPDALAKIADSLGTDRTAAEMGISAAVPGILAGLAHSASTPGGAHRLGSVVSQIHGMPRHEIVKHLLDADHRKLAKPGWSMLSTLAGSAFLQTLSASIARTSHLGQAAANDLLGLLAPVVLEFLRREQIAKGLDSKGIASLLASQRGNIRRAMPGEMAQHFQGGDSPGAGERRTAETFRRPEAPAARRHRPAGIQALCMLSAILLAGVAIYLLPMREETNAAQYTSKNITVVAKTSQVRHAMP